MENIIKENFDSFKYQNLMISICIFTHITKVLSCSLEFYSSSSDITCYFRINSYSCMFYEMSSSNILFQIIIQWSVLYITILLNIVSCAL